MPQPGDQRTLIASATPRKPYRLPAWAGLGLRFAACFAVLPNLPFWLFGQRQGIAVPGLVNLDAVLLGVASLFLPLPWVFAAFACDFLLDVLYAIRATFGTAYLDTLLAIRYMFSDLAPSQLISIAVLIAGSLAVVGLCWCYLRPRPQARPRRMLAGAVIALLLPWAYLSRDQRQAATARRELAHRQGYAIAGAVARPWMVRLASSGRSPFVAFYHAWGREHMWAWWWGQRRSAVAATPSAADLLSQDDRSNLVVVLVESWGEAVEPGLRQALAAPLTSPDIAGRYRIQQGTVAFRGQTPAGELRELCDLRQVDAGAPLAVAPADLAHCLGWRLGASGYNSVVLDSAASFWPGGANWYHAMGFQQVMGYTALQRLGLRTFTAGTFRSIRDEDVAGLIPDLLKAAPGPRLLFFLTVSAHLPVHLPVPAEYRGDCGMAAVTRRFPAVCGWYKIERNTLQAIAQAATAPGLPATEFVVVGDHAPPFVGEPRRHFNPGAVPYILLTRCSTANPGCAPVQP